MEHSSRVVGLFVAGILSISITSAADEFEVDPVHSPILFRVKSMDVISA